MKRKNLNPPKSGLLAKIWCNIFDSFYFDCCMALAQRGFTLRLGVRRERASDWQFPGPLFRPHFLGSFLEPYRVRLHDLLAANLPIFTMEAHRLNITPVLGHRFEVRDDKIWQPASPTERGVRY